MIARRNSICYSGSIPMFILLHSDSPGYFQDAERSCTNISKICFLAPRLDMLFYWSCAVCWTYLHVLSSSVNLSKESSQSSVGDFTIAILSCTNLVPCPGMYSLSRFIPCLKTLYSNSSCPTVRMIHRPTSGRLVIAVFQIRADAVSAAVLSKFRPKRGLSIPTAWARTRMDREKKRKLWRDSKVLV